MRAVTIADDKRARQIIRAIRKQKSVEAQLSSIVALGETGSNIALRYLRKISLASARKMKHHWVEEEEFSYLYMRKVAEGSYTVESIDFPYAPQRLREALQFQGRSTSRSEELRHIHALSPANLWASHNIYYSREDNSTHYDSFSKIADSIKRLEAAQSAPREGSAI